MVVALGGRDKRIAKTVVDLKKKNNKKKTLRVTLLCGLLRS